MAIMMRDYDDGGTSGPVFVCDHCGKQIEGPENGMFIFDISDRSKFRPIYFAHKLQPDCGRVIEAKVDAVGSRGWHDLTDFLVFLTNGYGLSPSKLVKLDKERRERGPL